MKFWQKIFFANLILFIMILDICFYFLLQYSYNTSKKAEMEMGSKEQNIISMAINDSIKIVSDSDVSIDKRTVGNEELAKIISLYADFYEQYNIELFVYDNINQTIVFSNVEKELSRDIYNIDKTEEKITFIENEDKTNMYVSAYIDENNPNLLLTINKDVTYLKDMKIDIIKFFMQMIIIVTIIMSVILYVFLNKITKPLKELSKVTNEIAKGDYNKRVQITTNDEISEFGNNFNIMADSIQKHIQELSESSNDKQKFIDNLSHELRTPITAIEGFANILQIDNISKEEQELALKHISQQSNRIQKLYLSLRDLTLLKNTTIAKEPIKVLEVYNTCKNSLNVQASSKNIRFEIKSMGLIINANRPLIETLIINLVENAIRYSADNSTIKIYDEKTTICVEDTGKGISKEEQNKIFEPFYTIDESRNRELAGFGLGLSICKKIAELHDAQIFVESEINVGTKMKIVF